MHCCISSLLMVPIFDFAVGKWLPCYTDSNLAEDPCSWLSSGWVVVVPCCILNLLLTPVLCIPACEWLLWLTMLQASWQFLSLDPQLVRGYHAFLAFQAFWCHLSLTFQLVSGYHASLYCKPANNACLGSSVCEWLSCLVVLQACWCPCSAFQWVSGCYNVCILILLITHPWISSW